MAVNPTGGLFISGKGGFVQVFDEETNTSTEYPLASWEMPLRAEFIKRNNYLSLGYQDGVSGFKAASPTIRGPLSLQFAPLTVGEFYWFFLGLVREGPIELQVYMHVTEITPSNNAEGAPDIVIRGDSVGIFTSSR